MRLPKIPLLIFILNLMVLDIYAGGPSLETRRALSLQSPSKPNVRNFINHKARPYECRTFGRAWSFVENKGQLADEKGNLISDVKYYSHHACADRDGGANIYCRPGMISFVFSKIENDENNNAQISEATGKSAGIPLSKGVGGFDPKNPKPSKISTCRADLVLVGANPNAIIKASEQQEYYENFYRAHAGENGITSVHTFKTITYKNIYPNIDLELKAAPEGMEYSFLVHPGGRVGDIQLRWNGINNAGITSNRTIRYTNALGYIDETKPISFANGKKVNSRFIEMKGNCRGFKIGKYDHTKELVIDPFIRWATYFGNGTGDGVAGLTNDPAGNTYITGIASSNSGLGSSGAYQVSNAGYTDAFLSKFDSTGNLLWSTYFGGTAIDNSKGVATDSSGNVYILGYANSNSGIATSGTYQSSLPSTNGAIFLAKFSKSGSLTWGTYYGGNNGDQPIAIATDIAGNIYLAGYTNSKSWISTSGAYQTAFSGGNSDAFLAKFNSNGGLVWATYFGGTNDDEATGICTDHSGNVYLTGYTRSTSGIATSGAYQTSYAGPNNIYGSDDFLAKFSSSGALDWSTYFGGTDNENGAVVATDPNGNVYIAGGSSSNNGIATSGAWQTNYAGNSDAFLSRFSTNGKLIWSTYFGGSDIDGATSIKTDGAGNVFIGGLTNSSSGIATKGAYQTSFAGGNYDAFLAEFNSSGILKFGSYFGGAGEENTGLLGTDSFGNIFLSGNTSSNSGIATSGGYISTNGGGNDKIFLSKFSYQNPNDAGIDSILNPSGNFCASKQTVAVRLQNYGAQTLKSVHISWVLNGKNQTGINWKGALPSGSSTIVSLGNINFSSGPLVIQVKTSAPNGITDPVAGNDSTSLSISVYPLPAPHLGGPVSICSGASVSIGAAASLGHSYRWASFPNGYNAIASNPSVSPIVSTSYYLTETIFSTGCSKMDSIFVKVNPLPAAITGSNKTVCAGTPVLLGTSVSVSGHHYSWSSYPKGLTSTNSSIIVSPTTSTSYLLFEKDSATGCGKTDSVKISVNKLPEASAGFNSAICPGGSANIGSKAVKGYFYIWNSSPVGFSSTDSGAIVFPKSTTIYILTALDSGTGCSKTDTVTVTVAPFPIAAFSVIGSCPGDSTSFLDKSTNTSSYSWSFGDSIQSANANPKHLYLHNGAYKVGLKVINIAG